MRKSNNPMGRTPKPVDRRRSEVVRIRFTPPELDACSRLALRHDLSVAAVVRAGIRTLAKQLPPAAPDGE